MSRKKQVAVLAAMAVVCVAGSVMADGTNVLEEVNAAIQGQIDTAMPLMKGLLVTAGTIVAMFVGYKLMRRGASKV